MKNKKYVSNSLKVMETKSTSVPRSNSLISDQPKGEVYSWKDIVANIHSPYNTYVFVSMRNSGKSKSIRNLVIELSQKVLHHNIVLFSTTAFKKLNDDYAFIMKSPFAKVYSGSKAEIDKNIDGILEHCKNMKSKNKEYSVLIIFDDIDVTKKNDKVAELFTQGRHYNLSVIVSSQNAAYFLSPTIRTNIDYLVFRKVENTYKKTLYNMCNTKLSLEQFKDYMDENTTDYKFILYDNMSQGSNDQERMKIVKAVLYDNIEVKEAKISCKTPVEDRLKILDHTKNDSKKESIQSSNLTRWLREGTIKFKKNGS